ncbi:MAG: S8 family serine peptidase [Pseudomonadota bacterium]
MIRHSLYSDGFSWEVSLSLAYAAQLAYQTKSVVEDVAIKSWDFSEVLFFDQDETQGFVAQDDDLAVISFRGSKGVVDWIRNMNVLRAERPYGEVHSGFLTAFQNVRSEISNACERAFSQEKKVWLTGHSLGGAVALIAAAELAADPRISGVQTFGQPRAGDTEFKSFINERLGERYFRFVNDDDLVTKIPPLMVHAGQLVHFGSDGQIRTISSESEGEPDDDAMTVEAFEALKQQLTEFGELGSSAARVSEELELDHSVEGLIPGVKDHSMDRYISRVRQYTSGESSERFSKVKSAISPVRLGVRATEMVEDSALDSDVYAALVRAKTDGWSPPDNVLVNSKIGTIYSVQATRTQILDLELDPEIVSISASRDAGFEELGTSIPFVGAASVHQAPLNEKGDAALIGIVDTGLDILHETFLDAQGYTRILAIWDQKDNSGPSPYTIDPSKFTQKYGTVYLAQDIDRMVAGHQSVPNRLRDVDGHGTHVGSIAAGRAVGSCPSGVAPEALLVCVVPLMKTEAGSPPSLGYSNSHVDALSFMKTLSQGDSSISAEARPIAINISLGMNAGAHDGTSLLEVAFDAITGGGRDEGCAIVKSAGNERGQAGHTIAYAGPGVIDIEWSAQGFRFQDYFEAWYSFLDDLNFVVIDPNGNRSGIVNASNPRDISILGGNRCELDLTPSHKDNGDSLLAIQILPKSTGLQNGIWKLEVTANTLGSSDLKIDMWVERDEQRAISFLIDVPETTISIPGTADSVIAVGAITSTTPVRLTSSSSFGKTRNDGFKPELCAPGSQILAAKSYTGNHQATCVKTGTSMAAPHVTGAVALAFSKRAKSTKPQLTANQLKSLLVSTSDGFSGRFHIGMGYGRLDVQKFISKI